MASPRIPRAGPTADPVGAHLGGLSLRSAVILTMTSAMVLGSGNATVRAALMMSSIRNPIQWKSKLGRGRYAA
jgi:hypothetical protein